MVEPGKKITIRKKESGPFQGGSGGPQGGLAITRKQDALANLENTVKKLKNRFQQFGFNDSREEDFLAEHKGQKIVVELNSRSVEGDLDSIDKYRIGLVIEGKLQYFYKHAVIGYYAS